MKKFFILIFLITLINGNLFAEISVKSFRKLENDMTARIDAPKKDQNGDVCAIIKVVTTQTGFVWEPDGLGIVSAEHKEGEYWLYVPYGAKRLTIKHPQLGILRDYFYTEPIEKAMVYELVLITGRVETTVVEEINSQWLLINPQPADAMVYFDDQFVKSGTYQAKVKPGKHTYRVEAPLYHTEAGNVEISDTKKELNVNLQPAFGYLSVSSSPEQGAKIIIDGKPSDKITPATTGALASGQHTVQVVKDMYEPAVQKVTVTDGQTTPVNLTLHPNFAELSVTAPENATVYINNAAKGTGSWQGRLGAGVYSLEARQDKYRPALQDIELNAGDKKSVDLQPAPIYGSLDVMTTPPGAAITIDGKDYGTTPNTINKLLIGDYTVQLSKPGYATVSRTATIADGKSSELGETLSNGRVVTISSTPTGAELYVDNQRIGITPYNGSLTFGSHTLRMEQSGKQTEKSITISQSGGITDFTLSLVVPKSFTETVNGISFDMIIVQGGTFQMGSPTNEKGRYDGKTQHTVTVSDYCIGKTEVTQALWQAVMGNNPSYFKGDNLPVEEVSWNDCQEFIGKLNGLTGKTYRLPTEAEWEYAARGGSQSKGYIYSGSNNLMNVAWYADNSSSTTHPVGGKQSNKLGLYDMSGNVWEWCGDWYGTYISNSQTDPIGPSSGPYRVIRGGSWCNIAQSCRVAYRRYDTPDNRGSDLGFRLVLFK